MVDTLVESASNVEVRYSGYLFIQDYFYLIAIDWRVRCINFHSWGVVRDFTTCF